MIFARQLSITVLAIALGFSSVIAEDWSQFGGPNHDFRMSASMPMKSVPTKRWQQTLGPGMSGVVVRGNVLYSHFLVPFTESEMQKPESERTHREAIVAMDKDNGRELWRHEYDAGWIDSQQAFGGRSRAPQATPAVNDNVVITIGFTGIMHCLDRHSGGTIWRKDLVESFKAVPVQFGFSASPLIDGDRVIVLSGGQKGGLVCVSLETGKTIWNLGCNEASYATPVLWNHKDGRQIVFATRNRIVGVNAADGTQLWEYTMPGKGLTNVPTPLPVDETGIVISGQGIKGMRRLDIERAKTGYVVEEAWQSGSQFFYCNWILHDGTILGCDGNLLLVIDSSNGELLNRHRGYNDSNLLKIGSRLLAYHGNGELTFFSLTPNTMEAGSKYSVFDDRCWTPPTPDGSFLYCRGGDQLLCLDLKGGDPRAALKSLRIRKRRLAMRSDTDESKPIVHRDPVNEILAVGEADGAEAAWKLYNEIRDDDPDSISFKQRLELAEVAKAKGLTEFSQLIMRHAKEDFPGEMKGTRKPSKEKTRGKNGLVYLEFALRAAGDKTIQAFVKGPAEHPFSYGLPIRPGKTRLEKWPVGTRLYRTHLGIRKNLLLTVEEDFAGRTIDVSHVTSPETQP